MRKLGLLWVVIASFAVSTANAQFKFGVKGGLNVVNAKFSKDVIDADNITGFQLGPSLEGMFGRGGLGFDLSLLYSQKGFKAKDDKVRNDFLEVPLNLKFKLGLPLVNPFIAFGPYAALRITGNENKTLKENASLVVDQVKTQSFGAGLNFSAGAEIFDHLQVGITYGWGLTDDYKSFDKNDLDSYKGRVHTWQITAAYFF